MRSDLMQLAAALTLAVSAAAVSYFLLVIRPRRAEARRARDEDERVNRLVTNARPVDGAMRLGGQQASAFGETGATDE